MRRRGAAPYADGCSHSIGAFTLHFPAPFCSTRAELAADMARFCVRHNGAKSTIQYTCASLASQSLFLERSGPYMPVAPDPPSKPQDPHSNGLIPEATTACPRARCHEHRRPPSPSHTPRRGRPRAHISCRRYVCDIHTYSPPAEPSTHCHQSPSRRPAMTPQG